MLTIDNFMPIFTYIQNIGSYIMAFFYSMGELFSFDILNNNLSQFNISFLSPLNDIIYTIDFGATGISTFISNVVDIFLKMTNTLPLLVANNTTNTLPFGLAIVSSLVGLTLVFFFVKLFKEVL